jgi:hypothetical protein
MSDFPFPHEGIILDACCIINLYASGYMQSILMSIPKKVSVAAFVRDVEANKIYSGPDEDAMRETELINLQPFVEKKLLQMVSPENEAEENTVVNFSSAAAIDSGEAITAAIAMHRQWSLATDDRVATAFFTRKVPKLHLISTLDILKYWADTTCPSLTAMKVTLKNIQNRARYRPHYKHHLYRWWERCNDI